MRLYVCLISRLSTLIELAQLYGVELPAYTEAGLRELVFQENYSSLESYLAGFKYTTGLLQIYMLHFGMWMAWALVGFLLLD